MTPVFVISSALFAAIITMVICHFYYNNEISSIKHYYNTSLDGATTESYRSGWMHGMADTTIENMGPIDNDTVVLTLAQY